MEKTIKLLAMLMLVLFSACAAANKTTGGGGDDKKTTATTASKAKAEDLSAYRPKFSAAATTSAAAGAGTTTAAIVPSHHVNDRVAVLMDTIASANKKIKYAQGFRILVYSGSQRETMTNIRKSIMRRVPEEKDYLSYKQPTYRLKVGDYFNRLEAQQVLQQIKEIAPQAMIIPDQINIRER